MTETVSVKDVLSGLSSSEITREVTHSPAFTWTWLLSDLTNQAKKKESFEPGQLVAETWISSKVDFHSIRVFSTLKMLYPADRADLSVIVGKDLYVCVDNMSVEVVDRNSRKVSDLNLVELIDDFARKSSIAVFDRQKYLKDRVLLPTEADSGVMIEPSATNSYRLAARSKDSCIAFEGDVIFEYISDPFPESEQYSGWIGEHELFKCYRSKGGKYIAEYGRYSAWATAETVVDADVFEEEKGALAFLAKRAKFKTRHHLFG